MLWQVTLAIVLAFHKCTKKSLHCFLVSFWAIFTGKYFMDGVPRSKVSAYYKPFPIILVTSYLTRFNAEFKHTFHFSLLGILIVSLLKYFHSLKSFELQIIFFTCMLYTYCCFRAKSPKSLIRSLILNFHVAASMI